MFELVDFSHWTIDMDTPFGSGASVKNWIYDPVTGNKGIFKYPKLRDDFSITGEYWAEKLAYEIASLLGIDSARIDIGVFNGKKGAMSYMLLKEHEELIEGIHYISKQYPNYNGDRFEDSVACTKYSIQMILSSLSEFPSLQRQFFQVPIFDCLIGNSDRHHSNWAIIRNTKTNTLDLSPLYDNGSSLCAIVNPNSISNILQDPLRFNALVYGKSKSLIGWKDTKKPRHFDLFEKIIDSYFAECHELIKTIEQKFTDDAISELVHQFDDHTIEPLLKQLLIRFLAERKNHMITLFHQKKEEYKLE